MLYMSGVSFNVRGVLRLNANKVDLFFDLFIFLKRVVQSSKPFLNWQCLVYPPVCRRRDAKTSLLSFVDKSTHLDCSVGPHLL